MPNIILHGFYYRYREERKQIKNLVQSENYVDAKNKIDITIIEHDDYIQNRNITNDGNNFTSDDNFSLYHARKHLDGVLQLIQEQREDKLIQRQKQSTIDALVIG